MVGSLLARTQVNRAVDSYIRFACRRPGVLLLLWTVVPLLVVVIGFLSDGVPELDTNVASGSYLRSDGPVSDRYDAAMAARVYEHERRERSLDRRLKTADFRDRRQNYPNWHIDFYFETKDGGAFDHAFLEEVRNFEDQLELLPSYRKVCYIASFTEDNCRKIKSATNFFYGTKRNLSQFTFEKFGANPPYTAYYIVPDRLSIEQLSISEVTAAMAKKEIWSKLDDKPHSRLWYFDEHFPNSRLLRSRVHIGIPFEGFDSIMDRPEEQQEIYATWIEEELYPFLSAWSSERVKLFWEGKVIVDHEVLQVVTADAKKALLSLALVYAYMAAYTKAPLVALLGLSTVVLAVPLGAVLFSATGHDKMPIINFLVLFLLTGIGADNLFILMDTWRQMKREHEDLEGRLRSTLTRAGKSIAACGTTTAVSFLANLMSAVRPLRWFGLFVGLCIVSNLVLSLGMFPAVLLLREKTKSKRGEADACVHVPDNSPTTPTSLEDSPSVTGRLIRVRSLSDDDAFCGNEDNAKTQASMCAQLSEMSPRAPVWLPEPRIRSDLSTEQVGGRVLPYDSSERFFGDLWAPLLYRCRFVILVVGVFTTFSGLVLTSLRLKPSRDFPNIFAPGETNVGDVQTKKNTFGKHQRWITDMEYMPLKICTGCDWNQNCTWGNWGAWSQCDKSCGWGERFRSRRISMAPGPHGKDCLGRFFAGSACKLEECKVDCAWGDWSDWGDCDVQGTRFNAVTIKTDCGLGLKNRSRAHAIELRGLGKPCDGPAWEVLGCGDTSACNPRCIVSNWSQGSCSTSCGPGFMQFHRSVQPLPGVQTDVCEDEPRTQVVSCNPGVCESECKYGSWQEDPDSECSASCGWGKRKELRKVDRDPSICPLSAFPQLERMVPCMIIICPPAPVVKPCAEEDLAAWSDWSACPQVCKTTYTTRIRSVPESCSNSAQESNACPLKRCPAECEKFAWKSEGTCSAACGPGWLVERRQSAEGVEIPEHCQKERKLPCKETDCPVNCVLEEWVEQPCSVTCGGTGFQNETRRILVWGAYGGMPCPPATELERTTVCNRSHLPCEDPATVQPSPPRRRDRRPSPTRRRRSRRRDRRRRSRRRDPLPSPPRRRRSPVRRRRQRRRENDRRSPPTRRRRSPPRRRSTNESPFLPVPEINTATDTTATSELASGELTNAADTTTGNSELASGWYPSGHPGHDVQLKLHGLEGVDVDADAAEELRLRIATLLGLSIQDVVIAPHRGFPSVGAGGARRLEAAVTISIMLPGDRDPDHAALDAAVRNGELVAELQEIDGFGSLTHVTVLSAHSAPKESYLKGERDSDEDEGESEDFNPEEGQEDQETEVMLDLHGAPTVGSEGSTGLDRPVDGDTSPYNLPRHLCGHDTGLSAKSGWWGVDLKANVQVTHVMLYGRNDCCPERQQNLDIYLGYSWNDHYSNALVASNLFVPTSSPLKVPISARGRYLFVVRDAGRMSLCEIEVLVDPTSLAPTVKPTAGSESDNTAVAPLPSNLPPGWSLPDGQVAYLFLVIGLKYGDEAREAAAEGRGAARSQKSTIPIVFNDAFDFSTASAQTAVERLCIRLRARQMELAIRRVGCFVDSFRKFLKEKDESYPLRGDGDIHKLVDTWYMKADDAGQYHTPVGFTEDGSRVAWVRIYVLTDLPWVMPAADAWTWAKKWDDFVETQNDEEERSAMNIGKIFHTTVLWVRSDTEIRLVTSTMFCAIISVVFAFMAIACFLGNIALAVYLMFCIICVVVCLATLMFGILSWTFGAVEAVGLIIVVGFSVDYSLHLAESYSKADKPTRYLKIQDALRRTGGALCGAAATSVLACPPILFCTIKVFVQFGLTVIMNMILSLAFSLTFFAALLIIIGPIDGFGDISGIFRIFCGRRKNSVANPNAQSTREVVGTVIHADGGLASSATLGSSGVPVRSEYRWSSYDDDDGTGKPMKKSSSDAADADMGAEVSQLANLAAERQAPPSSPPVDAPVTPAGSPCGLRAAATVVSAPTPTNLTSSATTHGFASSPDPSPVSTTELLSPQLFGRGDSTVARRALF